MLPKPAETNKNLTWLLRLNSVTAGVCIGLLGILILLFPQTHRLEHDLGLDWLFNWRGAQPSPPKVMVAAMDRASSDALGYKNIPRKWNRTTHADLVEALSSGGARAIGFDVLFAEPRENDQDQIFANTLREAGNTVLFENLFTTNHQGYRTEQLEPPIDILRQAALDTAPFALPKVPAKVSQAWLFKTGAGDQPTLPMVVFHAYMSPFLANFISILSQAHTDIGQATPEWLIDANVPSRPGEQASAFRKLFYEQPSLSKAAWQRALSLPEQDTREALLSWIYALTQGDSILLNLYGPARSIETRSIHKLLDSQGRPYSDTAIFVGFSEILQPEQKDGFYTSFTGEDGIDISGVELMATTFANLLGRNAIASPPGWQKVLLVFFIGTSFTIILFKAGVVGSLIAAALIVASWASLATWVFANTQLWLPITTILLFQLPAALLLSLVWRHRLAQQSKSQLSDNFKRFVPNELLDHFDQTGEMVEGRTVPAICLFTDMESYTPLGDAHEPQALTVMLNEYFQQLQPAIDENGGEVQDMTGDSMLSLWTGSPPDANRACKAALAIQVRQRQLPTKTRVGLHSGSIYRGIVGSSTHAEFRPVGDTINTAKRLESLNKELGTTILASREIAVSASDIHMRRVGAFTLRGKRQAMEVFEVRGLKRETSEEELKRDQRLEEAIRLYENGAPFQCLSLLSNDFNQCKDPVYQYYIDLCQT